jgi:hypothetical protein
MLSSHVRSETERCNRFCTLAATFSSSFMHDALKKVPLHSK